MKFVPKTVTRKIGRTVLTTKKNSPHIFFVGGVGAILVGTFLACRATLKLEETLDEIKLDVESVKAVNQSKSEVKHYADNREIRALEYTENDHRKDLIYVYAKSAAKLGRLYGPAVIVGSAGISAVTGSHIQLTRRNTALTMTLAAVSKAFDDYRIRVQEEIGEERELAIHRATTDKEVSIDGKKEIVKVTDPNGWSVYARWFDESSVNWQKDAELNRIFIQCQQNYANHLLQARGHVFLNEIYDSLGLERSQAGALVGWTLDGEGDGHIDFGLFEASNAMLVNNFERSCILDFNVDGVIYHKITGEY